MPVWVTAFSSDRFSLCSTWDFLWLSLKSEFLSPKAASPGSSYTESIVHDERDLSVIKLNWIEYAKIWFSVYLSVLFLRYLCNYTYYIILYYRYLNFTYIHENSTTELSIMIRAILVWNMKRLRRFGHWSIIDHLSLRFLGCFFGQNC